ncbi:MAG: lipopolysaccharide biosynthesis protein [Pseudomonadota bacterium]|nr:lipopolysaccharide biosynthesis protein [Pseudomonadota bacterium]
MVEWVVLHLAVAALGTWLALRYALWRNLLDHPGERRSHQIATPRGGGAAIVASVLVAAAVLGQRHSDQFVLLGAFAGGLFLVAATGWIDDHHPLSPWLRLAVQAISALGLSLTLLYDTGQWLPAAALFLAAMILTNVWNFMDGINGLAATQAAIVVAALAVVGFAFQGGIGGAWPWMATALAAACVGFLPYNFPRARIFLGDVGSGSIGFAVASLAVILPRGIGGVSWLVLFPLSAFLVDAGLTLLRRLVRREAWWRPHSQHAYQVWARRLGHGRVTLAYAAWTSAGAILMLAGDRVPVHFMLCFALAWYTSAALIWWFTQRMEQENQE